MGEISFETELVARGPAAAVILDDDQVAAVGEGAKRFPVHATVNGYTWATTVVRMRGEFMFGLSRENRTPNRLGGPGRLRQARPSPTARNTRGGSPRPSARRPATGGWPRRWG